MELRWCPYYCELLSSIRSTYQMPAQSEAIYPYFIKLLSIRSPVHPNKRVPIG